MSGSSLRLGFTMLSVLWLLALAGGITLGALAEARVAIDASRHRVTRQRGAWEARGCLAEVRAALNRVVRQASSSEQQLRWRTLDQYASTTAGARSNCTIQTVPVGLRLDVNAAEVDEVDRLLRAAGLGDRAPALAEAIHDWKGAASGGRLQIAELERNSADRAQSAQKRSFEADAELRLIPGLERDVRVTSYLGVETGRVSLMHAPAAVLEALPGFSDDAVRHLIALRQTPWSVGGLHDVVASAPSAARSQLGAAFERLSMRATLDPDGWRLIASVSDTRTGGRTTVEQELRRHSGGVVVVREITW